MTWFEELTETSAFLSATLLQELSSEMKNGDDALNASQKRVSASWGEGQRVAMRANTCLAWQVIGIPQKLLRLGGQHALLHCGHESLDLIT